MADEYTAQAGAAGQRATAAEQEAQHLEAQGKFADAAAAALQADRSAMLAPAGVRGWRMVGGGDGFGGAGQSPKSVCQCHQFCRQKI